MIPAASARWRMNRRNSLKFTARTAMLLSIRWIRSIYTTIRFRILFTTSPRTRWRRLLLQHKPQHRRPKVQRHDKNARAHTSLSVGRVASEFRRGYVAARATQSGHEGLRAVRVQGDQTRAL